MKQPSKAIRRLDNRYRIAIPLEIRGRLGFKKEHQYRMVVKGKLLYVTREGCVFCGDLSVNTMYSNKKICENCMKDIQNSQK